MLVTTDVRDVLQSVIMAMRGFLALHISLKAAGRQLTRRA